MITLISYILIMIGAFNWLSIGILQFDFVAGLFGSQANIFSRIVYAIIGFAAIWTIFITIKQRGKIFVNAKRNDDAKIIDKIKNAVNMNKNENAETGNETHDNTKKEVGNPHSDYNKEEF